VASSDSSSVDGSRPAKFGSRRRASARSRASRASASSRASRRNERPPRTAQVVAATIMARANGRRRVAKDAMAAPRTGAPTAMSACWAPAARVGAYVRRSSTVAAFP
jgi:hypothetical protein